MRGSTCSWTNRSGPPAAGGLHGGESEGRGLCAQRNIQMTAAGRTGQLTAVRGPAPRRKARPVAMLLRRKLCAAVLVAAVLLLMLASQSIHRRHFLPMLMAPPITQAPPISTNFEIKPTEPPAIMKLNPPIKILAEQEEQQKEKEDNATKDQPVLYVQNQQRQCGCSGSCVSELGGSDWFRKRYDPKQEPLLAENISGVEPAALQWWLGLQRSGGDVTLEDVMSQMFQVISPPSLDTKPLRSRCRSCAVVGNSGNLRESGHGERIDSHSFVIRMNKALTRGFEKDVGNRTTHHFLYPESAVDVDGGVSLVLLPFKLRDLEWLTSALSTGHIKTTYMRVKERIQADKDKVLVVNPAFFKYVHDRWTEHHGRYPSTGMLAIVFALHVCDQVSVFGYGADREGNWHHYWEKNRHAGAFRKTGVHNADFETEIIQQLAIEGKITLHR
ncbi:ST3 beta-galactoside alpha-2,3-sialyltransferase 8 isoform X2 [Oryzias latipes]